MLDYNLYFLLMDLEAPSSHQVLAQLIKELFKQNKSEDYLSLPRQSLLEAGIKKIVDLKLRAKDALEFKIFCQSIGKAKSAKDLESFKQTLKDCARKEDIKYIIQLKNVVNQLANTLLGIYQNSLKKPNKIIKLDLVTLFRTIFLHSHSKQQIQKHNEQLSCIVHKILGWIGNKETDDFIQQYKRRGQEIASLKEDCQAMEIDNKRHKQYMKGQMATISSLQQKLKAYQNAQIMEPNEQNIVIDPIASSEIQVIQLKEDKVSDVKIITGAKETQTERQYKLAIEKNVLTELIIKIDVEVETVLCTVSDWASQTEEIVETAMIQTVTNKITETQAQTDLNVTQSFAQTNKNGTITQETQSPSMQAILQQYQSYFRQKNSFSGLFQGDIFVNDTIYKQRLIKHIESKGGATIKGTRLLYRYDPLNPVNFHRYIDNIQGLVFVVKTMSGVYLAGYYSGMLIPDKILDEFGLLICLNNDESFTLLENQKGKINRSMVYDNFYAVFGNAELRVKTGEDLVFSNFGIMNAYYNHQGKKVGDFLGEGNNRQVKFEIYEFYQVYFEI